jgi:hypothetical protein
MLRYLTGLLDVSRRTEENGMFPRNLEAPSSKGDSVFCSVLPPDTRRRNRASSVFLSPTATARDGSRGRKKPAPRFSRTAAWGFPSTPGSPDVLRRFAAEQAPVLNTVAAFDKPEPECCYYPRYSVTMAGEKSGRSPGPGMDPQAYQFAYSFRGPTRSTSFAVLMEFLAGRFGNPGRGGGSWAGSSAEDCSDGTLRFWPCPRMDFRDNGSPIRRRGGNVVLRFASRAENFLRLQRQLGAYRTLSCPGPSPRVSDNLDAGGELRSRAIDDAVNQDPDVFQQGFWPGCSATESFSNRTVRRKLRRQRPECSGRTFSTGVPDTHSLTPPRRRPGAGGRGPIRRGRARSRTGRFFVPQAHDRRGLENEFKPPEDEFRFQGKEFPGDDGNAVGSVPRGSAAWMSRGFRQQPRRRARGRRSRRFRRGAQPLYEGVRSAAKQPPDAKKRRPRERRPAMSE